MGWAQASQAECSKISDGQSRTPKMTPNVLPDSWSSTGWAKGIFNSEIPLDIICTLPLCINLKRLPKLNNISIVGSWQLNFATVHSYSDERGERNLRWPHSWSESTGVVKPALNYSPFWMCEILSKRFNEILPVAGLTHSLPIYIPTSQCMFCSLWY